MLAQTNHSKNSPDDLGAPWLNYKKTIVVAVLAAAAMDTCSGLLLMLVPSLALRLMGVALPPVEALVFIRFVGAFVFSVGALYCFAGLRYALRGDVAALCFVLGATAWVRLVVFTFTGSAILAGALSWAWWSVPFTDGSLAVLQMVFLWKIRSKKRKVTRVVAG